MIPQTINETEFRYQIPPEETFITEKRKIDDLLVQYVDLLCLGEYEIEVNQTLLANIIVRVDERKDYYKYYHSTEKEVMQISRGKEIALLAYWIIKYKPFRIKGIENEEDFYNNFLCSFNEAFAALLIAGFVVEKESSQKALFTPTKISTMIYDFFNRDISKEAMIMYVESFIPEKPSC